MKENKWHESDMASYILLKMNDVWWSPEFYRERTQIGCLTKYEDEYVNGNIFLVKHISTNHMF